MKRNLVLLFVLAIITYSCSSDSDNQSPEEQIAGTWDAHELNIDDANATDDEKNGRDILNFLTANECFILTITLNEDLSVITENSVNYLEINVNQSGTGLDIPCPTQKDTEVSTYTFDGQVLTYIDENAEEVTVNVELSGDTMTVNAVDLDITNLNDGGQLIFKRR